MYRYQNNAFRIIGLTSDIPIKEIIQRVNEIKVKKSLDIDVSYELDFSWMGQIDRSEQNVINALQRLENPIARLKEEIFWFWIDTDLDRRALVCLVNGDRQSAYELWKSVIASDLPEKNKVSALVNQMILSHSSVIGREINLKYKADAFTKEVCPKCNMQFGQDYRFCIQCGNKLKKIRVENESAKKRNVDLSETHWTNWRFAINRISLLASNELFWERTREKAGRINDPRLSVSRIQEIRDNFLSDIANPNFRFLSQSLVSKDYERTKQHAGLLNGSSFQYEYLRKGFNEILASHVTLINRHCQSSSKEVAEFDQSENKPIKTIVDIYSRLEKNVSGTIAEGNFVDFNCISDYGLARDRLASNVKNIAIVLNNMLVADKVMPAKKREWGYQKAHEMVKKALEYAGSQYTKQKFAKDEELVKSNMEIERLSRNYYNQKTSAQSTTNSAGYSAPTKSSLGSNWKRVIGWILFIGFIGFIVVMANLPDDTTSNKPASSSTPSYSSEKSTAPTAYQLKTRIENFDQVIKSKEAKLLALESSGKPKIESINSLKREADRLEAKYNKAWFGKEKIMNEYNQVINRHNALLKSYQNDYSAYQRLFSEYERDLKTRNSLVESYNSKIR